MLREALYNGYRLCWYQEAWFSRGGEKAKKNYVEYFPVC